MSSSKYASQKAPGRSIVTRLLRRFRRVLERLFGPRVHSVQSWPESEFLNLFGFEDGPGRFDPSGADAVRVLVRHFDQRVGEKWPAIPNVLTDLRIDMSRMTDEELVARADRALAGDLHPSGLRPQLTSEGVLDWAFNPSNSWEWLLMIHRHAWWPLWGEAYQRTGDEKYARAFVFQLVDWIDQHPLPLQKSEDFTPWRLMEAGLRMRVSWIPSFACFFKSPAFDDSRKLKMLRAIYDHGQFLNRFHTNRNHLVRESNGLIAVGLCFSEFEKSGEWVQNGLHRLDTELQAQVNADGSHIEMSVGYQWLTIDEFETTKAMLDQYERKLPISDLSSALHKMYEFLASVIRPDRSFPQLNDGFILWDSRRLTEAGRTFGWADIEFAGSCGESDSSPGFCSRSFPNAGVHIMRSDWTADARYLIADTGPYGGPHGHEDKLSFELFAYGAPFIVDPGTYTYTRSDPYRNYFVGSEGHNTVLVDQGSQVRRWNARHMTPFVQDVRHGRWRSDDEFDFASGRYDEGYAPFSLTRPTEVNVDFDVTHQRDFVFVKPDYWVIADYLDARELHEYNFLFHLAPDISVEKLNGSSALLRSNRNGAQMLVQALTDQDIGGEVVEGSESPIQGWYSEDHHKKCASPVLSFNIFEARSILVVWVFYPLAPGTNAEHVRIDGSPEQSMKRVEFKVQFARNVDSVCVLNDPAARSEAGRKSVAGISIKRDGKGEWTTDPDETSKSLN
jgi:Heparinase II/III N-terminus/Heparinase II/III-like protein